MFDFTKLKAYLRGEFVDFKDANVSIANTGFIYGLAIFSGIRANYNPVKDKLYIFRPDRHYLRMKAGCKLARFNNFLENYSYEKYLSVLVELLRVNNIREDAYIRITNFSDENRITPKMVDYGDSLNAYLYPLGDYVPTGGMRCCVSSWDRVNDNGIPARFKFTGLYVNSAFAKSEALLNGYDEAIFLDDTGHVVEGSAANIFIVIDGVLITPPVSDNILEGITRDSVIAIANDEGIPVVERSIDRSELYRADEVFLTGTGAKVSPVIEIDKRPVGEGVVGPISQKLQDIYFQAVRGDNQKYLHWLCDVYR